MMDYAPVFLGIFFIVVAFLVAMNHGVVGLLASGLSLAAGLATVLAGFEFLPGLAKQFLDLDLSWKFTLAVAAGAALLVFLIFRFIFAFILKALFSRDAIFHPLSDGVGGGVLSLGPSLLTVLAFFLCVRLAGTVLELNYIDSLARAEIREMGGQIPPYPMTARWRDGIDALPFMGGLLDSIDPLSPRAERNAAALVLASDGVALFNHLKIKHDTGPLAELPGWLMLSNDPVVSKANEKFDRLALILAPAVQEAAARPDLRTKLQLLVLRPSVEDFVKSIEPAPAPADLETQL